ncbi:MAG: carbohydrate ABC transporter permease [Firmicutes bacterium]|nr:carbohydrate ABC transporter permease [Bacillota bacterium]
MGTVGIKETAGERIFYGIIIFLLVIACVVVLYPLIHVVSVSFSNPYAVMANEVGLLPKGFTLEGYRRVFQNPDIWRSYRNTIAYTVVGTFINIVLTSAGAYALSRRDFYGRKVWTFYFTFTMFFGGGLIPTYLLIQKLKLVDTFWVMVILGAVSTWNMIIMRTFFQSNIPISLQEAAIIDGANDLKIFITIVIPLSTPILAVMVLFYGVGHWNAFFNALIYLNDRGKYPLQLILREILLQNLLNARMAEGLGSAAEQEFIGESIRYASIVVATLPIMMVYPFLQKYFVKGILIGAIKG